MVPGVDGAKMSKSYGNTIELFAEPKPLRKRIMGIVTDSTPVEDPKDPDRCTVFALYRLFATPDETEEMASRYRAGGMGYGEAKKALHEKVEALVGPAPRGSPRLAGATGRPGGRPDRRRAPRARIRRPADGTLPRGGGVPPASPLGRGSTSHSEEIALRAALVPSVTLLLLAASAQADVSWPTSGWLTSSPAAENLDPTALAEARDYALTGGGAGLIARHGRVVMEWGDTQALWDTKSTTKSIGAMILGLALDDAVVALDDSSHAHWNLVGTVPAENGSTGWAPGHHAPAAGDALRRFRQDGRLPGPGARAPERRGTTATAARTGWPTC